MRGCRPVSPQQPILENLECKTERISKISCGISHNGLVQGILGHVIGQTGQSVLLDI